MLSDEEKEAIEWLKRLVKLNKRDSLDDTFAEILLNLIEKQSKEIEELKDESKEYQIGFAQGCYEKDLDWEDKIKAKIEEIEKDDKKYKNYTSDGRENFTPEYVWVRPVLQSLLEKE